MPNYVIIGGNLGKDDRRVLDYELAVGDPVNVVVGRSGGAPVYAQRVVKRFTEEHGTIRTEVGKGKLYCPFCDVWDTHDVLACAKWDAELSEQERREAVLRLSRESRNARWTRADWIVAINSLKES